jgi:hypothetical protein
MFYGREQKQYEHIKYTRKRLLKRKKENGLFNLIIILAVFGALGYLGTDSIFLAVMFALLAALIRGTADDIIRELLLAEHNRAICEFDGDSVELRKELESDNDNFIKY